MARIYEWTRYKYVRNTINSKWRMVEEAPEVSYITEEWRDEKTGPNEVRFWRLCADAYVRVHRNPYTDVTTFTNISPTKLEKREEVFRPLQLTGDARNMGYRECEAFYSAHDDDQRVYEVVMHTPEHIVLAIGVGEKRALLDIKQMRWVG